MQIDRKYFLYAEKMTKTNSLLSNEMAAVKKDGSGESNERKKSGKQLNEKRERERQRT